MLYDEENRTGADWRTQRMDEVPAAERRVEVERMTAETETDDAETLVVDNDRTSRSRFSREYDTPLNTEVVRIRREDEYSDDDPPFDPDNAESAAETDASPRKQRFKLIRDILLGTILNRDIVREYYRYAAAFAFLLFGSIVMLFSSLDAYIKYTKLDDEVRLLRERSIRMSEQRYELSSHSAVVRRLKERGINLSDPLEPREILND